MDSILQNSSQDWSISSQVTKGIELTWMRWIGKMGRNWIPLRFFWFVAGRDLLYRYRVRFCMLRIAWCNNIERNLKKMASTDLQVDLILLFGSPQWSAVRACDFASWFIAMFVCLFFHSSRGLVNADLEANLNDWTATPKSFCPARQAAPFRPDWRHFPSMRNATRPRCQVVRESIWRRAFFFCTAPLLPGIRNGIPRLDRSRNSESFVGGGESGGGRRCVDKFFFFSPKKERKKMSSRVGRRAHCLRRGADVLSSGRILPQDRARIDGSLPSPVTSFDRFSRPPKKNQPPHLKSTTGCGGKESEAVRCLFVFF